MVEYSNRNRKPFYVGQLVRWIGLPSFGGGLDIILDIQWDTVSDAAWEIHTLDQRTGIKQWLRAEDFEPVGENDVKESK